MGCAIGSVPSARTQINIYLLMLKYGEFEKLFRQDSEGGL